MADPVIEKIIECALRLYPGRDHRVGMRSAFMDAACICTRIAQRIEAANPGRGKGSVSQVGQAIADAVRRAGDELEAVCDRIEIEERKPLPQSDCQVEHPRGGISHEPDSPLLRCQDDFGRRERKVPRFERRNPAAEEGDMA